MGVLSLGVSLFWIVGLRVEGAYGVNVLLYTETLPAIAGTSLASEVVRGLGYWYFYGSDRLGPWMQAAVKLEESAWLLVTSFAVPTLGAVGAVVSRWRAKAFFVLLILVGVVLAVGMHPYADPSIVGRALKAFMTGSSAGLALRSTDRATPLVVLGFSMLLGAGTAAIWSRLPRLGLARRRRAGGARGRQQRSVSRRRRRRAELPASGEDPRLLRRRRPLPRRPRRRDAGAHRAGRRTSPTYDWGTTFDPIWPGIMTRPEVLREQTIQGSYPTTDLLQAFDLTLQQGTYEPSTLAPIARLFSAGDVVLQSNLAFWRYNTPRPQETWALFDPPPPGIGKPVTFGTRRAEHRPAAATASSTRRPWRCRPNAPWPPPVAVFPVSDPRPIYRAEPAAAPLVIDGSGAGVVAAAGAGLLADNPTIFYAGTLDGEREAAARGRHPRRAARAHRLEPQGPRALVERQRQHRRDASGRARAVRAGPDRRSRCRSSPTCSPTGESVAVYSEARYVTASAYGNPVTLHARGPAGAGLRRQPRDGLERGRVLERHRQLAPDPPRPPRDDRSPQPGAGAGQLGQPVDHSGDHPASTAAIRVQRRP